MFDRFFLLFAHYFQLYLWILEGCGRIFWEAIHKVKCVVKALTWGWSNLHLLILPKQPKLIANFLKFLGRYLLIQIISISLQSRKALPLYIKWLTGIRMRYNFNAINGPLRFPWLLCHFFKLPIIEIVQQLLPCHFFVWSYEITKGWYFINLIHLFRIIDSRAILHISTLT